MFEPGIFVLLIKLFTGNPYTDACPVRKDRNSSATSEESFELIESWLYECKTNHLCSLNSYVELPTRLIDLETQDRKVLRLYEPEPGTKGQYVALSYCWGKSQAFTVNRKSISTLLRGFSLSSLPKTIQDAVQVTRAMGVRYLWVDALCILQGSDKVSQKDWKSQSSRMESIYGNAYFTISATAARDSNEGFLHPQSCNLPFHAKSESGVSLREGLVTVTTSELSREWKDEPINQRGWALQERLLSARVVSVSWHQTTYLCDSMLVGDDTGVVQKRKHAIYGRRAPPAYQRDLHTRHGQRPLAGWAPLVMDYSAREITMAKDKLVAIGALARRYHMATGDQYLAGLWKSSLHTDLLWTRGDHIFTVYFPAPKIGRPKRYRAPSWSWASIDGIVSYVLAHGFWSIRKSRIELMDYRVKLAADNNPFGMVEDAWLLLRGRIKEFSSRDIESTTYLPTDDREASTSTGQPEKQKVPEFVHILVVVEGEGTYAVGLILEKVHRTKDVFRRIGVKQLSDEEAKMVNSEPFKLIKLI
jgi:hypothetical protein